MRGACDARAAATISAIMSRRWALMASPRRDAVKAEAPKRRRAARGSARCGCWPRTSCRDSTARDLSNPGQPPEEIPAHRAVHDEVVAVDVARVGTEQERDDVGDVLGRRHPAERYQRRALARQRRVLVDLLGHAGA